MKLPFSVFAAALLCLCVGPASHAGCRVYQFADQYPRYTHASSYDPENPATYGLVEYPNGIVFNSAPTLTAKGYTLVADPSEADYLLQLNAMIYRGPTGNAYWWGWREMWRNDNPSPEKRTVFFPSGIKAPDEDNTVEGPTFYRSAWMHRFLKDWLKQVPLCK